MKIWHVLVGVATIIGVLITFQITIESYQNRLFQAELAPIKEQVYNHLPTDIAQLRTDIQDVKNELKSDIQDVKNELQGNIQDVKNELQGNINSINTKLDQLIIHLIPRSQLTETSIRRETDE